MKILLSQPQWAEPGLRLAGAVVTVEEARGRGSEELLQILVYISISREGGSHSMLAP